MPNRGREKIYIIKYSLGVGIHLVLLSHTAWRDIRINGHSNTRSKCEPYNCKQKEQDNMLSISFAVICVPNRTTDRKMFKNLRIKLKNTFKHLLFLLFFV